MTPANKGMLGVLTMVTGAGLLAWWWGSSVAPDAVDEMWAEEEDGGRPVKFTPNGRYLEYPAAKLVYKSNGDEFTEDLGYYDDRSDAEKAAEADADRVARLEKAADGFLAEGFLDG